MTSISGEVVSSPAEEGEGEGEGASVERRAAEAAFASGQAEWLASLRVLIVHDWIVAWGGAERTLEQLVVVFPQAHLLVGLLGEGRRNTNAVTARARESWLARLPFARRHHRWFLPLYSAAFATVNTSGYDLVISSSHAFAKGVRPAGRTPHLCYCHSPPRYLWDLHAAYRRDGAASGLALALAAPLLRLVDKWSARGVSTFVANSQYIADRIRRCYGREAVVVYPPVSAKPVRHRPAARDDILLSLGRLVPYKRVDLAILAANRIGARLIVAGEGPERARLERLAGASVTFVGEVSEVEAGDLMERCRAMIFCAEEDFGIAPVEANAHGLPVVAFRRGGAVESLRDGVTAEFFDHPTVDSLVMALERARRRDWDEAAIRANAETFSAARFRAAISDEVARLCQRVPGAVVAVAAAE